MTTKSQGGSGWVVGWGGVLGPCQWRPYSFWLPWINLLAGELWGEGRSGGISSVALLWLSAELSARTHTQNAATHTINMYVHTPQAHSVRDVLHLSTPASRYSQNTHTSLDGRQKERADKNRKKGRKHLCTFRTFHFLLIVGGVALCWSLSSADRKILKLKPPASSPTGLRVKWLGDAQAFRQTKHPSHLDSIRRVVHHCALRFLRCGTEQLVQHVKIRNQCLSTGFKLAPTLYLSQRNTTAPS